jgi:hypothetical protein
MPLSYEVLKQQDATTTNAIIDAFSADASFTALAAAETEGILARDAEDASKLAAGIILAVDKGVLEAEPPIEPTTRIDVLGKSVDEVCDIILDQLGDAPESGCIFVLSGLSGTGKGTTVARLQALLPRAIAWSNGNVFRSLTLLALEHCAAEGLAFCKNEAGAFDIRIVVSEDEMLLVSEVQNTLLKQPRIGKNIPTVAKMTQGEVIKFAAECAGSMRADGMNVLIEGRTQTLDYVRSREPCLIATDCHRVIMIAYESH